MTNVLTSNDRRVVCGKPKEGPGCDEIPQMDGDTGRPFFSDSNAPAGLLEALARQKTGCEKTDLFWIGVNEVTWKLTDGQMIRTPASHGQWGGFETERAIAWVVDAGWPMGRAAWYARYRDKSYGPTTTVIKAKAAALALVAGAPLENDSGARAFQGAVNLHVAALIEPAAPVPRAFVEPTS